jgi:alcohol dehydrogenase
VLHQSEPQAPERLAPFDFQPRTRVVFGAGSLARVAPTAVELGFRRTLIVADPGIVAAGYVERAAAELGRAGILLTFFHDFDANPNSRMVDAGRAVAEASAVDSIVALGGGSSLDCAKGINFVLTGGGSIRDYRGFGKARRPMLPSIGIPTTAGTGSEAQSFAIISDAETHAKMACGDPKAAFHTAILDPELTVSQPRDVTAVAGYDAVSHAVEAYVTTKRNAVSVLFAREAWRLLESNYERVLASPRNLDARGAMLLGAHEAGIAIEQSMLGATHACANPLTARYGTMHGLAIAVMLPHVVRWNGAVAGRLYGELLSTAGGRPADASGNGDGLASRLGEMARAGGLPVRLRDLGTRREDLPELAADAATQWTGSFNPRPFDAAAALSLYQAAY